MSFIGDASLALKLFGIIFVFYWIQSNVKNRLLAILIMTGVLYYLLFYAQSLFWLVIGLGLLLLFPGLSAMQDIYFQYGSAKELSARQMAEYEQMMAAQERRINTPYGPRWGR